MFAQLRQFWTNLGPAAKVAYSAAAVLLIAIVGGVGYWSSQTPYAVLFPKLPTEETALIVQKLDADRVSYKLTSDGTILVPTDKVQNMKMNLAVAGLPQGGGKGYELFDTMSMGATPFVQNMNYIRAIQGELQRTIMTLEPIASARVHITQPDQSVFVRDEKPVTASVIIKTKPGATLSRPAVEGIVKLTAGSVKGLTAENVTVVESDGRVLSEKRDSRTGATSNDQLSHQREVEAKLVDNAQEILTPLLGPGRAVVRVTAEMSFRQLRETSEKFDPDGKVVQHEEIMSAKMSAAALRAPVGAVSNIPPAPAPVVPAVGPNKNEETISTEYLVSRLNQEKAEQQEVIDRLTVAVILMPKKVDGDAPEDALGITLEAARELVKQAVGFKEDRGDQIQVSVGKPPGEPAAPPAEAAANHDDVVAGMPFGRDFVSIVRGSSLGIAGLIVLAIVVKLSRRKPSKSPEPAPAFANLSGDGRPVPDELADLHAVAATIKAWLEEPTVIRFDQKPAGNAPQAKPA